MSELRAVISLKFLLPGAHHLKTARDNTSLCDLVTAEQFCLYTWLSCGPSLLLSSRPEPVPPRPDAQTPPEPPPVQPVVSE